MTTDTTATGTAEAGTGDDTTTTDKPKHDAHLERVRKERDAAKQAARDAASRLAELERTVEAAQSEGEKLRGETGKLLERMEKKLADAAAARDAALAQLAERAKSDRAGRLAEAVARRTGQSAVVIRALLREAAATSDYDSAPEEIDEDTEIVAVETVRRLAPDLIGATRDSAGGAPGTAGSATAGRAPHEQPGPDAARKARILATAKAAGQSTQQTTALLRGRR